MNQPKTLFQTVAEILGSSRTLALVGAVSPALLGAITANTSARVQTSASPEVIGAARTSRPVGRGPEVLVLQGADTVVIQYGALAKVTDMARILEASPLGAVIYVVGNLPAHDTVASVMAVSVTRDVLAMPPWYFYGARKVASVATEGRA
jgi:hypothetical protein